MDHYDEFLQHLRDAHTSAEKALNLLYKPGGPKRGVMYRMALGRAQSALISLYVKEVSGRYRLHGSNTPVQAPPPPPPPIAGVENVGRPRRRFTDE